MPIADHSLELLDADGNSLSPAVKPHFLSLKGNVQMRQEEAEQWARGGVAGHGFRRLGQRGTPFVLTSVVDAPSLAVAADIYGLVYRKIPNAGLVDLEKDDLEWGQYMVRSVQVIGLRAVGTMAGGFSPVDVSKLGLPSGYSVSTGASAALLTCRWTLIG